MTQRAPLRSPKKPRSTRSALRQLADRVGILPEYIDNGDIVRETSDETRVALLAAMGFHTSTDEQAKEALAMLRSEERLQLLPPVRVVELDDPSVATVDVRAPRLADAAGTGRWQLRLRLESGERLTSEGAWVGERALRFPLPKTPTHGYHDLHITLSAGGREWSAEQRLIVVPARCVAPEELLGPEGAFGVIANLYTVRSKRNWGVGDAGDLGELARWAGSVGAQFVGINPLHALMNRGDDVSPYSPVSRLFRNPIYLRVEDIPELKDAPAVAARLDSAELREELEALRETPHVRYEQVMAVKGLALDALHHVFAARVRGRDNERARAYDAYVAAHEPALTRFATWMAIAEEQGRGARGVARTLAHDWHHWPAELRAPDASGVAEFARAHAERIDYHRWVQFELDRQLAEAARVARDAGMRIGLYQDLAIGSSPRGADTWAYGSLFASDASVGAPPDPLAPTGQNWGFPPIDPRALQANRYDYFVRLVRAALRHGGALRIDHVLGFFRLFWIPRGGSGADGAYVRYPVNDLLGILALESERHRALIVGEDLGTIPKEVPRMLERRGVLSSKVLMFERDASGGFKAASKYPRLSLATANTHDMASIAGFSQARDLALRAEVGLAAADYTAERARQERQVEIEALVKRLAQAKLLPRPKVPLNAADLRGAVHAFLSRTPAALVGLALDDLTGEVDPVNIPGVESDRYPCWTRKMRMSLEQIPASADVHAALRGVSRPPTASS